MCHCLPVRLGERPSRVRARRGGGGYHAICLRTMRRQLVAILEETYFFFLFEDVHAAAFTFFSGVIKASPAPDAEPAAVLAELAVLSMVESPAETAGAINTGAASSGAFAADVGVQGLRRVLVEGE